MKKQYLGKGTRGEAIFDINFQTKITLDCPVCGNKHVDAKIYVCKDGSLKGVECASCSTKFEQAWSRLPMARGYDDVKDHHSIVPPNRDWGGGELEANLDGRTVLDKIKEGQIPVFDGYGSSLKDDDW